MSVRVLVLEGGGMRAAYTNGVMATFEDAGLGPLDAVYGTSAGGALAAWFSAGQARYALGTWRYAEDARVLSWRRWLTMRGPLLDHDALFRIVYQDERPLDVDAVQRAPHKVIVSVTDLETGRAEYVDIRQGPVIDWLRATGRLPVGAGPPVEVGGRKWLDGGLADPIPIAQAIRDGGRDIVCVLNEPRGERDPESGIAAWVIGRRYPAVRELVIRHHTMHDDSIRLAERPPPGVTVHVVQPQRHLRVGRLTRDPDLIGEAILEGERDGRAFIDGHPEWFRRSKAE